MNNQLCLACMKLLAATWDTSLEDSYGMAGIQSECQEAISAHLGLRFHWYPSYHLKEEDGGLVPLEWMSLYSGE